LKERGVSQVKAKKTKSGKYKVVISVGKDSSGKYRQKAFTAPTKKEAELLAAQFQMKKKDERQSPTVQFAIDKYIESRSSVLSPSSIRGYRTIQRAYFRDFENNKISDITNEDIQRLINDISFDHAPKTVKNAISLLVSALTQIDPEKRYLYTLPKARAIERNIPDNDDISNLMEESKSNRNLHLAIILSALGTLRRGEVCAICYEDILRDFNAIYIHSDIVKDENHKWTHKNFAKNAQSTRQVIYPKEVIELLGEGTGRIITCSPDAITSSFIKLRNRLGMKCRFHDLRHYTISIMHSIGIPDQYIQQRSGHKDARILQQIYRNPLKSQSNVYVKKTNEYFSSQFEKEIKKKRDNG
jgi:integrase